MSVILDKIIRQLDGRPQTNAVLDDICRRFRLDKPTLREIIKKDLTPGQSEQTR